MRAAIFDSVSPGLTRYSSAPDGAGDGAAAGRLTRLGAGAGAAAVRGARGAGATGADGAAAIAGAAAGGRRRAGARAMVGGSNSSVYSRTRRPVDQEISRITSTNGSCTARSLLSRR